jgi:hypothetical protein
MQDTIKVYAGACLATVFYFTPAYVFFFLLK